MHTKKQFLLLLLTLVWLIFPSGLVFSAGVKQTEPAEVSSGPVEVVFWHSNSGLAGEATTELVNRFNRTIGITQQITVTEVFQGKAADVATKLRASLQADRP